MAIPPSRAGRQPPSDPRDALASAERAAAGEIAKYIAQMSAELQSLASGAQMPLLAQFLAMARIEAEMQARMAASDE